MTTKKASSWILALTLFCGGCGAMKKVDSMKATTEEMNRTTKAMDEKMADMTRKTERMEKLTNALYRAGLQGGSDEVRARHIKLMDEATELDTKNSHAGHYYAGMEVQFWQLSANDKDGAVLEKQKEAALKEYFGYVKGYLKSLGLLDAKEVDLKPLWESAFALAGLDSAIWSPVKDKNNRCNLGALVLALHTENPIYIEIRREFPEFKPISMRKMLEEGLEAAVQLRAGKVKREDLPLSTRVILREEKLVAYLFQLRYNYAQGVVLERLQSFREMGFFKKLWQTKVRNGNEYTWNAELDRLDNEEQLAYLLEILDDAKSTRTFLTEKLGQKLMIDDKIHTLLGNIKNPYTNQGLAGMKYNAAEDLKETHISSKGKQAFFLTVKDLVQPD